MRWQESQIAHPILSGNQPHDPRSTRVLGVRSKVYAEDEARQLDDAREKGRREGKETENEISNNRTKRRETQRERGKVRST